MGAYVTKQLIYTATLHLEIETVLVILNETVFRKFFLSRVIEASLISTLFHHSSSPTGYIV